MKVYKLEPTEKIECPNTGVECRGFLCQHCNILSALKEIDVDEDAVLLTDKEIKEHCVAVGCMMECSCHKNCAYKDVAKAARDKVLEALK